MKIKIAERLKPFSHQPGTRVVLPNSHTVLQVFPTLVRTDGQDFPLSLTGPVKQFTVQLDLEKGCVWMWGFYREGYHRFCLWSDSGKLRITRVRGDRKDKTPTLPACDHERLSLGSHRKQDWCLVSRRMDLIEIFPHWLKMGQFLPPVEPHDEGMVGFLNRIPQDKNTFFADFCNLFGLGFDGILNPLLEDSLYQGVQIPEVKGNPSPLALISEGAKRIRSLFIEQSASIAVLPCLPPQFHCGRFISIDLGKAGRLDIEWSKKMIRRMIFFSAVDQEQRFTFQKEVKNFRLRENSSKEGRIVPAGDSLSFKSLTTYYFDRFLK